MKKNIFITTWLLALTIVLSGCSKGRSYDSDTKPAPYVPRYNAEESTDDETTYDSNIKPEPYVPRYNAEESTDDETTYDDSGWDEELNDDDMYDEYEAICDIINNNLEVLNDIGFYLSTDDASFQNQADKVTSDFNLLKEAWEEGDFDKIDEAKSDLLRHTQKLQEMIRDYKLNQHTGPYTLNDDYEVLGGEENDFLLAPIDTVEDAIRWDSVLYVRIGDQYDSRSVTWDDDMENDDDIVRFINTTVANQALDSGEKLPILRAYFDLGYDDATNEGRLIDDLNCEMRRAYEIVNGWGYGYSASNVQTNTLAKGPVLTKKM